MFQLAAKLQFAQKETSKASEVQKRYLLSQQVRTSPWAVAVDTQEIKCEGHIV